MPKTGPTEAGNHEPLDPATRPNQKRMPAANGDPQARWRWLAWLGSREPRKLVLAVGSEFDLAMTRLPPIPQGAWAIGSALKNCGETTSLLALMLHEGVGAHDADRPWTGL